MRKTTRKLVIVGAGHVGSAVLNCALNFDLADEIAIIDIINKNKDKPMEEQKEVLLKELKSYQGEMERIDDITFLAVEI